MLVPTAPAAAAGSTRAAGAADARFDNFATPPTLQQDAGEPSIGVDRASGNVMFEASSHTLRVRFDDATRPATATWVDRTAPTSVFTLDPILFVDPHTNRTFVSQLDVLCSLSAFSDSDGQAWIGPTQGCSLSPPEDHQTVGGGPYHQPPPPGAGILYPNAVYYCHQDGVVGNVTSNGQVAYCGLSVTGSITYGPGVPIYTGLQCGGLHGHVKVGPDGTVYVPNQGCDGATFNPAIKGNVYTHQAVVVSENNGALGSWAVRSIPDSRASFFSDPSVGIGSNNAVYFGYQDGGDANGFGRHPKIAVSHDHGHTWSPSVDVGLPLGIENSQFPMVVAGDDDRAAFAFLGSTTPGEDQVPSFNGIWHLYVAMTYDGGATWVTRDATPNDPVQRGCVELIFPTSSCPHRNLLDFNDMTVDGQGRVLAAYADGCTDRCVTSSAAADNKYLAVGTIARQACGMGLFAAFDSRLPSCTAGSNAVAGPGGGQGLPTTAVATSSPSATVLGLLGAVAAGLALGAALVLSRRFR